MTEWNLIFPLYDFSHSFEETEMCDKVAEKLSAEGREGKQRVSVLALADPCPRPQRDNSVPGEQILLTPHETLGGRSWTKSMFYFVEMDESNHIQKA